MYGATECQRYINRYHASSSARPRTESRSLLARVAPTTSGPWPLQLGSIDPAAGVRRLKVEGRWESGNCAGSLDAIVIQVALGPFFHSLALMRRFGPSLSASGPELRNLADLLQLLLGEAREILRLDSSFTDQPGEDERQDRVAISRTSRPSPCASSSGTQKAAINRSGRRFQPPSCGRLPELPCTHGDRRPRTLGVRSLFSSFDHSVSIMFHPLAGRCPPGARSSSVTISDSSGSFEIGSFDVINSRSAYSSMVFSRFASRRFAPSRLALSRSALRRFASSRWAPTRFAPTR